MFIDEKNNISLWLRFHFKMPCMLFIGKINVQFTNWDIFVPFTSEGIFAEVFAYFHLMVTRERKNKRVCQSFCQFVSIGQRRLIMYGAPFQDLLIIVFLEGLYICEYFYDRFDYAPTIIITSLYSKNVSLFVVLSFCLCQHCESNL